LGSKDLGSQVSASMTVDVRPLVWILVALIIYYILVSTMFKDVVIRGPKEQMTGLAVVTGVLGVFIALMLIVEW
jgi:hypothetical protein